MSPPGVRATAAIFALTAIYLATLGILMLARPASISMSAGAPLLFGLELAGPYMFLLTAATAAIVAFGLFRLNNLARRAALLIAIAGVVMLVPNVSAATVTVNLKALATAGAGIIVRVIIAWHLARRDVADQFRHL